MSEQYKRHWTNYLRIDMDKITVASNGIIIAKKCNTVLSFLIVRIVG